MLVLPDLKQNLFIYWLLPSLIIFKLIISNLNESPSEINS